MHSIIQFYFTIRYNFDFSPYFCTGLVLFHPSDAAGYKLRLLYVLGQHTAILFLICTHLRSTLWRSIRYLPEFFQALFEDVGMTLVYVQVMSEMPSKHRISNHTLISPLKESYYNLKIKSFDVLTSLLGAGVVR